MLRRKFLFVAILAGIAIAGPAPPARADFVLVIADGAGNYIVADQTTGTVTKSGSVTMNGPVTFAPGIISVNAGIGSFALTVSTATGNPILGTSALDLTNVSVTANAAGSLTVTTYQTGDSLTPPGTTAAFSTSIGGTLPNAPGVMVSAQTYFDVSNVGNSSSPPTFTAPAGSVTGFGPNPFTSTSSFFSGSGGLDVTIPANNTFALAATATLTFSGAHQVASYDLNTTVSVPAPPALFLALSALPALGLPYVRRRRKRVVA